MPQCERGGGARAQPQPEPHVAQALEANAKKDDVPRMFCMQGALERMGLDASAAVARAQRRSQSRVGRKRARSAAASAGASVAMDVDGEPAKKRVHSSKSRCAITTWMCAMRVWPKEHWEFLSVVRCVRQTAWRHA